MRARHRRHPAGWVMLVLAVSFLCSACGGAQNPNRIRAGDLAIPDRTPTRYFPKDPSAFDESDFVGEASWYGERHHGRRTATGQPFNMYAFTAAHRTLPFNTVVRVTRVDDRRNVVVRINDRGPGSAHRVIDLSWAAASDLGIVVRGHAQVRLEVLEWGDGAIYEDW